MPSTTGFTRSRTARGAAPNRVHTRTAAGIAKAALAVVVVAGAVLGGAGPAAGHGVGGVEPSNYETSILGMDPSVEGVQVRVRDTGDSIELSADPDVEVVVLGYEDEPYLRFDAEGVFENHNSPAVFLNRSRDTTESAPPEYDASREPDWRRISTGHSAQWHDHRAHWMGANDPPAVRDDPGSRHVVIDDWEIPIVVDGANVTVSGDVTWIPGPAVWPWLVLALALFVAAIAVGRTRRWPTVLAVGLSLLVVLESTHIVGLWFGTTGTLRTQAGANVYSFIGVVLGGYALWRLARRPDPYDATPAVLVAAIVLFIAGGLADLSTLGSSQLPTALAPALARLGVAVALGAGAGTATVAAMRLRRPGGAVSARSSRLRRRAA